MGILQFGKPAWTDYGADGNADGTKDLYNIDDAAWAAANFLHAKKAETALQGAADLLRFHGRQHDLPAGRPHPGRALPRGAHRRPGPDQALVRPSEGDHREEPRLPTLGKQSDIPEPVGNNAQPGSALSIAATPARSWSTPALDDDSGDGSTTAMSLAAYSSDISGDSSNSGSGSIGAGHATTVSFPLPRSPPPARTGSGP